MTENPILLVSLPGIGNITVWMYMFAALSGIQASVSVDSYRRKKYRKAFVHCFIAGFCFGLSIAMAFIDTHLLDQ